MKKMMSLHTTANPTLKEGYLRFIQRKRAANLSPDTLQFYEDTYSIFIHYIGENTKCNSLCEDTVLDFITYMRERNKAIRDTSINTYLRGLRSILYFFMSEGYTPEFKVKMITAEKPIKETYTNAELERLLKKPNIKTCSFSEYRNWVLVCYLLGTGNRAKTLCNLTISDIDFTSHEIKLRAVKNNKPYIIPLSRTLEKTLAEYIEFRKGGNNDYLFCNSYGQQMCYDALKTAIHRYNKARGVTKTSVHLFRHTFAKNWILNNGDIFRLQKILGHQSIEIVKEYVNMFGSDLQQNFEVFNPLDNMEIMKRNNGTIRMKG
ncbi:MAG: tyrosine-type recombinase/integrase [Clostridiales bacterium]|nr:tyrosine-type recombinase/integrase [Clostridiales bacterium]